MGELDYQRLPEWVRVRIEGLSIERGWSIERCLEEIVIEAIAMGGLTSAGRPKASVVQLRPKEGLKSD
ncbi:TPA: hypothetical protein ACTL7P_004939 [Pseudomonas aeruginosa]|uniref:hypothetical protein n=2 Tax=Pseudomonas aeruginosa TaxID=287 RepID=UPI0003BB3933|nr:hypothetical protein [Pseudomonas aeruginosa]QDH93788.1 hypothetical protein [Pseudomonas phage vB_PaS_IME307]ARG87521.1 hypothetical protein E613_34360 [Pseudomonas aeruginosa]AVE32274.1 hypothetical protein HV91_08845 [Pseudomonas aeruginosa]EIU1490510.1 hypothetical protein [Pseudomonas aeruginosa]EIU2568421.1 hypothetical protein [Pseudomonas aeruginosa]